MIRKGMRPKFRFGLDLTDRNTTYRRVLPFKRSWLAIGILAVFDIIFTIPAISTLQDAIAQWGSFDDLFDLVIALFQTGWLLAWITAPIIMTVILAVMLLGRESINVSRGKLEQFFGLPGIGIMAHYDVSRMRNLRMEYPQKKSGKSWRGPHLAFDYGANRGAFGSGFTEQEGAEIIAAIEAASGQKLRHGEATEEELAERWEPEAISVINTVVAANETPEPLTLSSPSTLALIFANLVPLIGAVLLDWNLGLVMVLYWAESGVIGLFNIIKLIQINRWMALMTVPFFIGHFGVFMAVHFLFIYSLFIQDPREQAGGDLAEVGLLFVALWPALLALFASHAVSYFQNFLGRREYLNKSTSKQMQEPYSRIVFMHLVVIIGGGLSLVMGEATPVLMVVIAAKIWVDIRAHLIQRDTQPK
jgi:hypothetical protein